LFFIWLVAVVLAIILLAFIVHWAGGGLLDLRLGHFVLNVGFTGSQPTAAPPVTKGTGAAESFRARAGAREPQAMIIQGCSIRLVSVWRNFAARAPSITRWSTDRVYLSR
jgi:hypothetical protein